MFGEFLLETISCLLGFRETREWESLDKIFGTSLKTFQRYERENQGLNPQDSEKVLKIMALFQTGESVFGTADSFRRWLDKPAYSTRALACLENVVHRGNEGLLDSFRVMVIDVPDTLLIDTTVPDVLPANWFDYQQYNTCQLLGREWLSQGRSAVLRVPSALIPNEWNYLLNPAHPDFPKVQLGRTEPLAFDPRIKS